MAGVTFKWEKPKDTIVKETLHLPAVLLFASNEWRKLYNPFVPMASGLLANDAVQVYVEDGIGIIHHTVPYARRQYFGTTHNFSKEKHPLASAKWDDAARSAGRGNQLIKSVQDYIKGDWRS